MSRAGRKRKHQLRRKGIAIMDTSPERQLSPNDAARRMPHRRLVAADHAHDDRMESPLGAQYVIGAISRELYVAGLQYGMVARRYLAAITAPRQAESIAGVNEPKHRSGGTDTYEGFVQARNDYLAADDALVDGAGKRTAALTRRVIVEEAGIPPGGFRALCDGLRALAGHFENMRRHT